MQSTREYFMLAMHALKVQINNEGDIIDDLVNKHSINSPSYGTNPNMNITASHPDIYALKA